MKTRAAVPAKFALDIVIWDMRLCLIGCGRWGTFILRDLLKLGCEMTVCDISQDVRTRVSLIESVGFVERLEDIPVVDGYVIATPTATHSAVLEQVIQLGKPIFVEKPMTSDPTSAARIASNTVNQVFVMDKWRYHPGVQALKVIAHSGELGKVLGLRSFRRGWGNPHTDVDSLWILLPHDLSIALEIIGFIPEPKAAIASVTSEATYMLAQLGIQPWLAVEVSARHAQHHRAIELHCEYGLAILSNSYDDKIIITRDAVSSTNALPVLEDRAIATALPLLIELEEFTDFVRGGKSPRSNVNDGALIVSTIAKLRNLAGLD